MWDGSSRHERPVCKAVFTSTSFKQLQKTALFKPQSTLFMLLYRHRREKAQKFARLNGFILPIHAAIVVLLHVDCYIASKVLTRVPDEDGVPPWFHHVLHISIPDTPVAHPKIHLYHLLASSLN